MSSLQLNMKEQRRLQILQAACAVPTETIVWAKDRTTINSVTSKYPKLFGSVVKLYGRDMVVQIISSMFENGSLASEFNARPVLPKSHQPSVVPSVVRDRQHHALEREAANSEAKAQEEASRSNRDVYEVDQNGRKIDVAGTNVRHAMTVDPANVCE